MKPWFGHLADSSNWRYHLKGNLQLHFNANILIDLTVELSYSMILVLFLINSTIVQTREPKS